ncbi:methyl-accepting chemotaxis protein, partial [Pelatocladus sp. BLCC-F211]|uniref:methyl-accepting chemotaxis protein n=1 Tax=Pelatocladus sp. BLCC-F211 TaxID=3342752 RepID=UPI0035B82E56
MLANWKLRDRTLLGFSLPTFLIFIFSGMVYLTANQAGETFREVGISHNAITGTDKMALNIANMDRRIRRYLLLRENSRGNSKEALERYKKDRQLFQEGLKLTSNASTDPGQKQRLQKMALLEEKLDALVQETLLKIEDADKSNQVITNYLNKTREINDDFEEINDEFNHREQEILGKSIESTKANINSLSFLAGFFSILSLIIATIATVLIAKYLGARVATALRLAEKISAGDLTSSLAENASQSKDEVGQLLEAFKTMTQNLNTLIRQVQKSGVQVTTSTMQIATSGKQLEVTVTEQVASTNEVAAAAKEISATSKELVKTMEEVAIMSQATTTAATESQKDLLRMETTMRQLAEATNSIASRLGVMSEKANN